MKHDNIVSTIEIKIISSLKIRLPIFFVAHEQRIRANVRVFALKLEESGIKTIPDCPAGCRRVICKIEEFEI